MTTPEDPERVQSSEGVDLSKGEPAAEPAFDPYRFGKPEHPIPAEYAPPGYTGPVIPATPPPPPGWAAGPPGAQPWPPGAQPGPPGAPGNPFSNPPGTPYAPYGADPSGYPPSPYPQAPPGGYPPPYGPPGYYPPTPPQYAYGPQRRPGSGKAVAALVLGVASIIFCFFSFLDALLVIPGLILALIAMNETKVAGGGGRGLAVAGLICSIVGGALAALFTALLVHAANQCGGLDSNNEPGWNTCVRDHLF